MDEAAIENGIEVSSVERPPVEPETHTFRKQVFQMPARRWDLATDCGMHAVIVVKHRWRAEELKSANHGVPENMGYRDGS